MITKELINNNSCACAEYVAKCFDCELYNKYFRDWEYFARKMILSSIKFAEEVCDKLVLFYGSVYKVEMKDGYISVWIGDNHLYSLGNIGESKRNLTKAIFPIDDKFQLYLDAKKLVAGNRIELVGIMNLPTKYTEEMSLSSCVLITINNQICDKAKNLAYMAFTDEQSIAIRKQMDKISKDLGYINGIKELKDIISNDPNKYIKDLLDKYLKAVCKYDTLYHSQDDIPKKVLEGAYNSYVLKRNNLKILALYSIGLINNGKYGYTFTDKCLFIRQIFDHNKYLIPYADIKNAYVHMVKANKYVLTIKLKDNTAVDVWDTSIIQEKMANLLENLKLVGEI